jgi:hypothetical protein
MNKENLIYLFHHIHHKAGEHETHHCGGSHKKANYLISHCACGLHRINKRMAMGDAVNEKLAGKQVRLEFTEACPEGGWHIESGRIVK